MLEDLGVRGLYDGRLLLRPQRRGTSGGLRKEMGCLFFNSKSFSGFCFCRMVDCCLNSTPRQNKLNLSYFEFWEPAREPSHPPSRMSNSERGRAESWRTKEKPRGCSSGRCPLWRPIRHPVAENPWMEWPNPFERKRVLCFVYAPSFFSF